MPNKKTTDNLKKLKFYNQFIDYGFDAYISTFQNYFSSNPEEYNQKLSVLEKNLSAESFNQAIRFLRVMNLLPLPSCNYLVKKSVIYNDEEIIEIFKEKKFYNDINKFYTQYNLQGFEKIEINVFRHHCGLKPIRHNFKDKYNIKIDKYLYKSNMIDGGAFYGDSALIFNKFYRPHNIYAFEPSSVNYNSLQTNIQNNHLNKVIIAEKLGLTNNVSRETLNYISTIQNHGASFVFKPNRLKTEEVNLTTIDNYVQENKINNLKLIKLDVEGYGLKAVKGAKETITKYKPIISCAVYHNPEEFFDILPLLRQYNKDYTFELLPLSHSFILKEMTLMAY